MTSVISVYPCLYAHTWEVYPRVFYFRGRFIDLCRRFQRILKATPKALHDEKLQQHLLDLTENFEKKTLSIMVIGRENLTPSDIFVSPEALKVTENTVLDTFPTIVICYVTAGKLDRRCVKDTVWTLRRFNETALRNTGHRFESLVVMCKTQATFTEEQCMNFRENIFSEAPKSALRLLESTANILISSDFEELKQHISTIFEARIVEALTDIRRFLNFFVPDPTLVHQPKLKLLKDRHVTRTIKGFLRNGFGLSDLTYESYDRKVFHGQLIAEIARIVKCVVIAPMSSKYTLPSWLCNRVLHEIQFEDVLVQSVSKGTHYHLNKLHHFAIESKDVLQNLKDGSAVLMSDVVKASNCTAFDFILPYLQKDFRNATTEAERELTKMKKVKAVMSKMIFEINGYLKQTKVQVKYGETPLSESALTIPYRMRKDIMSVSGVYGMGTIYGTLEIHLDENDEAAISHLTSRIKSLMREHQFHHTYHIKFLKH